MSSPVIVHVLYPASAAAAFNMDYYLSKHMPLVEKTWKSVGLQSWTITKLDEETGFSVQALLFWESLEAFEKATKDEVVGDIKMFTDSTPKFWIGTVAGKSA